MAQIAAGCREFDEDLSAWIDGELATPRRAAVDAHLAGCRACTSRVEELRAVDLALRALPAPAAGAALRDRLALRLAGARAPSAGAAAVGRAPARARRRLGPALALPFAAAAALALYLTLRPTRAPEGPAPPVPIARAPEVRAAPAAGELDALDPEELAVLLDLETIEDLPVIANLELLERLLAAEAG